MKCRFAAICLVLIATFISVACEFNNLSLSPTKSPEPTSASAAPKAPAATETPTSTMMPSPTYTPEPTKAPLRPTSTLAAVPASETAQPVIATPQATQAVAPTPQSPAPQPTSPPASSAVSAQTVKQQIMTTKRQMEEFGGMIDIAIGQGYVDCSEVVLRYDTLVDSPTFDVAGSDATVAQAYDLYRQGVAVFASGARDMAQNCRDFIESGGGGSIPFQQWGLARQRVNEAIELLNQGLLRLP